MDFSSFFQMIKYKYEYTKFMALLSDRKSEDTILRQFLSEAGSGVVNFEA